jgi:hypothetical protein
MFRDQGALFHLRCWSQYGAPARDIRRARADTSRNTCDRWEPPEGMEIREQDHGTITDGC